MEQSEKLEKIQKTCLKIILDDSYVDYDAALEMCGLETLASRRHKRCLDFALKAVKHPKNRRLFALSTFNTDHLMRKKKNMLSTLQELHHIRNQQFHFARSY